MKSIKASLSTILNMFLPVKKKTVLFRSFYGQYNDNPKYISEELHRKYPDVDIIWTIRDGKREEFPEYAKLVELDSSEYAKYCARAQVVVDNYSGCRSSFITKRFSIKHLLVKFKSKKRKKQLNISTWHGTPLKHIALDEPGYKKQKFIKAYLSADKLISGNKVTEEAFKTALNWKRPVMMCGTPRNDILFNSNIVELKEKLGLPKDKRVVLFAPTFRNDTAMSGIAQIKDIELDKLFSALSFRFGGEWVFVFRSHNLVMKEIEKNRASFDARIINGNAHPDMAEYLAITDVLITDYSSSMFDFMLGGNPCFLYTPDLENYRNSERGFYFDIESVPFSFSADFDELLLNINNFDSESYNSDSKRFLEHIGNTETGTASKAIVAEISEFMKL